MSDQIVTDELGELRELADRIHHIIGHTPVHAGLDWLQDDELYWEVAYTHSRVWPEDKAAQLLVAWRNGVTL